MIKILFTISALFAITAVVAQGNYVFSGSEIGNFSPLDLSTLAGQTWSTARTATPGYFSAINGGSFTGASDAVNINGYVKEYNNTSFSFPVGTGNALQTLTISNAPAINTIATAWITGDPTYTQDPTDTSASQMHPVFMTAGDIVSVSYKGQWDWQDFNSNAAGTNVTVLFPDLSAINPAPLATTLRLVGWNGTQWINLSVAQGANAATGIAAGNTLTGTMQGNITALGIGFVAQYNIGITIMPNPAVDNIEITGIATGSRFEIIDMLGQVVIPFTTSKIINVSNLAKGQYVLKVIDTGGQSQTNKFIKQ